MARFVVRRVIRGVLTLLVASFLIFGALYLTPGSPLAFLTGGRTLPPAAIAALKAQYHLNQPFLERYFIWLGDVLHGNLGQSLIFHESVSGLITPRITSTLFLVAYAALLILVIGIGLGLLAATRPGRVDTSVTIATTIGLATPTFVMAIVLISLFSVTLGWFPAVGSGSGLINRLWHLTLPAMALAISGLAYMTQTARAALRSELGREHVLTARARGLPRRVIIRHHVLRNAAIPIATVGGVTIASLFAAVAVVEVAFGLQGIGSYLIQSVTDKDFPVVQAISLLLVTAFVVTNTVVDILYYVLDPRLRRPVSS